MRKTGDKGGVGFDTKEDPQDSGYATGKFVSAGTLSSNGQNATVSFIGQDRENPIKMDAKDYIKRNDEQE